MERRKFLKIAGVGVAAVAVIPVIGYTALPFNDIAVNIILRECESLKIARIEAEKFVEDFYAQVFKGRDNKSILEFKLKLKSYYFANINSEQSEMVHSLVRNFLLSSDFFRNKMDESKPVKYVYLYDPYKLACANPFSNIFYPAVPS